MKILNLYAGIGGNRKLWGDEHDVVAVESDPQIAMIYQLNFPSDRVVVGDAHAYLLEHYNEFDFIWASPPCPSHSKVRFANQTQNEPIYPDMTLYQEIIFLQHYFKGAWVVENVVSFYDPLIKPYLVGSHYFWSSFPLTMLSKFDDQGRGMGEDESIENLSRLKGFDLSAYEGIDKKKILRNCVEPKLALHIFNLAFKEKQLTL